MFMICTRQWTTMITMSKACNATTGPPGLPLLSTTLAATRLRNYLRHYRLHRFLIAIGDATAIYVHSHIWTDSRRAI